MRALRLLPASQPSVSACRRCLQAAGWTTQQQRRLSSKWVAQQSGRGTALLRAQLLLLLRASCCCARSSVLIQQPLCRLARCRCDAAMSSIDAEALPVVSLRRPVTTALVRNADGKLLLVKRSDLVSAERKGAANQQQQQPGVQAAVGSCTANVLLPLMAVLLLLLLPGQHLPGLLGRRERWRGGQRVAAGPRAAGGADQMRTGRHGLRVAAAAAAVAAAPAALGVHSLCMHPVGCCYCWRGHCPAASDC